MADAELEKLAEEIDIGGIDSVVLRRLIEEVRNEEVLPSPHLYDRIYNRHNR